MYLATNPPALVMSSVQQRLICTDDLALPLTRADQVILRLLKRLKAEEPPLRSASSSMASDSPAARSPRPTTSRSQFRSGPPIPPELRSKRLTSPNFAGIKLKTPVIKSCSMLV